MNPSLATLDPAVLGALLVCGHALADFALQTRSMALGKNRFGPWAGHVAVVAVVPVTILLPWLGPRGLAVLVGLALVHGLVDRAKSAFSARRPDRALEGFLLDQGIHAATLVATWIILRSFDELPLVPSLAAALPFPPAALGAAAVLVAAYAFVFHGGSAIVAAVLDRHHLGGPPAWREPDRDDSKRARPARGHAIGVLERWIVLTLVLAGEWGALGLLLAAKSVARFRDLDERELSEYYLIGTLTSVLVAAATALLAGAALAALAGGGG